MSLFLSTLKWHFGCNGIGPTKFLLNCNLDSIDLVFPVRAILSLFWSHYSKWIDILIIEKILITIYIIINILIILIIEKNSRKSSKYYPVCFPRHCLWVPCFIVSLRRKEKWLIDTLSFPINQPLCTYDYLRLLHIMCIVSTYLKN